MGKRILVIGAGLAGLSAASYLQRNGFETEIFELHDKPGGLCTAWTRQGFTIDGCIHWLLGSGRSSHVHRIWEELGAGDIEYIEWDDHVVARLPGGEAFTLYTDPDRLKAEILRLGPEDEKFAELFCAKVKAVAKADIPAAWDRLSLRERLSLAATMPALVPIFSKWMKVPLRILVDRLKSERLRDAFRVLFGEVLDTFPAGALFLMIGFMAKRSAGYPIGGSLAFVRAIEAAYLELGGRIRYGAKVDRIIVEAAGGAARAVGLAGAWGESRGDYIVSAADGRDTLDRLLAGAYKGCALDRAFESQKRYPSLLFLGLGLGCDCSGMPHAQAFDLDVPLILEAGALIVRKLNLRLFNFDPSLAPPGKTSASIMIETSNDAYWTRLAERDRAAYAAEKKAVIGSVIAAVDRVIPGFASWVEVADLATPRTFIRYTNNWHGSYEGWLPTSTSFGKKLPRTIEGLEGFEMVGQWVNPGGGLPPCAFDGRRLARRLCRREGRRFRGDGRQGT